MRGRSLSAETVKKAELLTDALCRFLQGIPLVRIAADDLGRFREGWKASPSTARKKLERLRSFFKFCVDRDWIAKNPAKSLKAPKESVIEKKPFEKEQYCRNAEVIEAPPSPSQPKMKDDVVERSVRTKAGKKRSERRSQRASHARRRRDQLGARVVSRERHVDARPGGGSSRPG